MTIGARSSDVWEWQGVARLRVVLDKNHLDVSFGWRRPLGVSSGEATLAVEPTWAIAEARKFDKLLNELVFELSSDELAPGGSPILRSSGFEHNLREIGRAVWEILELTPQVADGLRKYASLARDAVVTATGSELVLVIETNLAFIPWELCVIEEPTGGTQSDGFGMPISLGDLFNVVRSRSDVRCTDPKMPRKSKSMLYADGLPSPEDYRKILLSAVDDGRTSDGVPRAVQEYRDALARLQEVFSAAAGREDLDIAHQYADPSQVRNLVKGLGHALDFITLVGPSVGSAISLRAGQHRFALELADVRCEKHYQPVVFLDCCDASAIQAEELRANGGTRVAEVYLESGASALLGPARQIEPIVAVRFAAELLNAVAIGERSVLSAARAARQACAGALKEPRHYVSLKLITVETINTQLRNTLRPFVRGHEPDQLCILAPTVSRRYFAELAERAIPAGVDVHLAAGIDTLQNVVDATRAHLKDSSTPFLADLPILAAAKLISETRSSADDALAIVDGTFRLTRTQREAYLYYHPDRVDECGFRCEYALSTPSVWALLYLLLEYSEKGQRFLEPPICEELPYRFVQEKIRLCAGAGQFGTLDASVVAGDAARELEEYLASVAVRTSDVSAWKRVITFRRGANDVSVTAVDLSGFFFAMAGARECAWADIDFLPASVVVARRRDLEASRYLYNEVLSMWQVWKAGVLRHDLEREAVPQDVILSWTEMETSSVLRFVEAVAKLVPSLGVTPLAAIDFQRPPGKELALGALLEDKRREKVNLLQRIVREEVEAAQRSAGTHYSRASRYRVQGGPEWSKRADAEDAEARAEESRVRDQRGRLDEFVGKLQRATTGQELDVIWSGVCGSWNKAKG